MERALLKSYIDYSRKENNGQLGKKVDSKFLENFLSARENSILSLLVDDENKSGIDKKIDNLIMNFKKVFYSGAVRNISSSKFGTDTVYYGIDNNCYYLLKSGNNKLDFLIFERDWADNDHQSRRLIIKHNNGMSGSEYVNYTELNHNKHSNVSEECFYSLTSDERGNYSIKSKHYNDFSSKNDDWDFDLTYHDYSSPKRDDRSK